MNDEVRLTAEQLCAWLRGETPPETAWDAVIRMAAQQGLAAVLYKQVKAAGAKERVPPELWTLLQETYLDNAGRSLRRQHQVARILQMFRDADIPVIALKGAHLGAVVYDDPALRPMQDLDVLVKPEDLSHAEDLLCERGYTLYGDREEYEQEHFHYHYHLPDPAELPVELHWHLLPPEVSSQLNLADLWQRAQPARLAGIESWVLAPEDVLVYLCLHTAYIHVFEGGLKTCYDIGQILAYYGPALAQKIFQGQVHPDQFIRPVSIMFYIAHELLAIDIPSDMPSVFQPSKDDAPMLDWVMERMFIPEPAQLYPESTPLPFKSFNLAQFWKVEKFSDKVHILLTSLFPAPHILAQRYSVSVTSKKMILYYVLNVKDMMIEHMPVLWRLLRHEPQTIVQAEEKYAVGMLQQQSGECENRKTSITRWLAEQQTSTMG